MEEKRRGREKKEGGKEKSRAVAVLEGLASHKQGLALQPRKRWREGGDGNQNTLYKILKELIN